MLDIDKRMCWDFVKDNKFMVNLQRPIIKKDVKTKTKVVLLKYIDTCYSIDCPLMIMYRGYTYTFRLNIFYYFIKQFLFIFLFKLPFSQYFPKLDESPYEDIIHRCKISYILVLIMQLLPGLV